jgi:hypothetical protein
MKICETASFPSVFKEGNEPLQQLSSHFDVWYRTNH